MRLNIKIIYFSLIFLLAWSLGLIFLQQEAQAGCADKIACCCEHGCSKSVNCRLVGGVCTSQGTCGEEVCSDPVKDRCTSFCQTLDICGLFDWCWIYTPKCCNTSPQSGCGSADPTPPGQTPPPGGGGGGGGACSGVCVPPAANCGVYGYPGSASGSCSGGQMCCRPYDQPPNSCNIYYISPIIISPGETKTVTITIRAITWGIDYVIFGNRSPYFTFSPYYFSGPNWCSRGLFRPGVRTLSTTIIGGEVTPPEGIQTSVVAGWNAWSTPYCSHDRCCNIGNCSTRYFTVIVTPPGPWWQAQDGDIVSQGNLISLIPGSCTDACIPNLILDGDGGYPGVAVYGGGSYDFAGGASQGTASSKNWLANSSYSGKAHSYSLFESLIPSSVTINTIASDSILGADLAGGGVETDGYVWYKREGDLTITGDLTVDGDRKVVLLVSGGDLNINGNIDVASPGNGFFGALVGRDSAGSKGNINVDSAVTALDGVFWVDNTFASGSGSDQLVVTGAIGGGGISLQRDLGVGNSDTPAELFVYDPTLAFTFPQLLSPERIIWREVAP